jgi:hypothetical protein
MCIKIFFIHFFHLNSWYADAARQVSMLTFLCLLPEASVQVLMSTFASFLFLYDRSEMHLNTFLCPRLLSSYHGMGWNREIQVLVPTFASFLLLKASAQMHMEKELVLIFANSLPLNGLAPTCI